MMALEANARKTEHSGAKNSSHDKPARRADLKAASRKLRRRASRQIERDGARWMHPEILFAVFLVCCQLAMFLPFVRF